MDVLDVWPALPLVIEAGILSSTKFDNIMAAFKCSDRVCKIDLRFVYVEKWEWEEIFTALQQPFPGLIDLRLRATKFEDSDLAPVNPDSFLGGSAPHLRYLDLERIPFPDLPKLLSTTPHLVELRLSPGYISLETMVTCLSTLTSLKLFWLGHMPASDGDSDGRHPPPHTRSVLPALTFFLFKGDSKYLEDLLARIDTPQLDHLKIEFDEEDILNTTQFTQFISHSTKLKAHDYDEAYVDFHDDYYDSRGSFGRIKLLSQTSLNIDIQIRHRIPDRQLASLSRICVSCLPLLSMVEDLYFIEYDEDVNSWQDDNQITQWLELLRQFIAVKNLYLSRIPAQMMAPALLEVSGNGKTEVLPSLQNILLKGQIQRDSSGTPWNNYHNYLFGPRMASEPSDTLEEEIGRFVAARQLSFTPLPFQFETSSQTVTMRYLSSSHLSHY